MYRIAIEELVKWKNNKRRKPLIIRGARQVGKTWLMKEFGRQEFEDTVYLNFDRDAGLEKIFKSDISPTAILGQLEIYTGNKIDPQKTLLIFDEAQEVPRALTSLKYFCEEAPEYYIVAAGSLLGIALHQGTSFPVGKVEFMNLYPFTFHEFLAAVGKERFIDPLVRCDFELLRGLKSPYETVLKQYFLIGGMPKAIETFVNNGNYEDVRMVHQEIIDSYDLDISKHAPSNHVPRIRDLYASIPKQLSKEKKKFVYGNIKNGARGRDYELALMWLSDCGLIHRVNRLAEVQYPIKAFEDMSAFKIYLSDVGLLSQMAGLDERILLGGNQIFDAFKGALTEQYVLQELIAHDERAPLYWSNPNGNSEVDFIMQTATDILPIEVKSGINLQAKGLKYYMEKYQVRQAVRTSLADHNTSTVTYGGEGDIPFGTVTDIPLYALLSSFLIGTL